MRLIEGSGPSNAQIRELMEAVGELVSAHRSKDPQAVLRAAAHLASVWEKHPRRALGLPERNERKH